VDIRSVAEYDRANGIVIGVIQDVTEQKRNGGPAGGAVRPAGQPFGQHARHHLPVRRPATNGLTGFQYVSESIRMVLGLEPSAILADPRRRCSG